MSRNALSLSLCGLLALGLTGCNEDIEGNEPGECSDGADNDSDSYFDCNDSDCYGAPDCLNGGDDDDAADDDDATDDDDAADDDDATDDDDDTTDGFTPYISDITYEYVSSATKFIFSLEAHDPDSNFGIPLLLWSVDGVPQTPANIGTIPLTSDVIFDVELQGVVPGSTYSVLFAIQDADANLSEGYVVNATAE